jgi:hypothetical protein
MPRPTQPKLIDTSHPDQKKILDLAEKYREARDARMEAQKPESEAKQDLLDAMHAAQLDKFECDGIVIEVVKGAEKVKVRTMKDDAGDDAEPDELTTE